MPREAGQGMFGLVSVLFIDPFLALAEQGRGRSVHIWCGVCSVGRQRISGLLYNCLKLLFTFSLFQGGDAAEYGGGGGGGYFGGGGGGSSPGIVGGGGGGSCFVRHRNSMNKTLCWRTIVERGTREQVAGRLPFYCYVC